MNVVRDQPSRYITERVPLAASADGDLADQRE